MKFPFIGAAYTARSLNLDAQRCINLYPELDKSSKNVIALFGTPGKTLVVTAGAGPIRGLYAGKTYLYAVSGNTVYYINTSWVATSMGTLNTSSGPVHFAENETQLVIADGTNLYTSTLPTGAVTQVSDPDVPANTVVCDMMDGYTIVNSSGTEKFYISAINDATAWDPLDFASAEGSADNIVTLIVDHRELWLFGTKTTEVWYDSGNSDFPFERIQGGFIEQGCAAAHSVAKADNAVFWLSSSDRGDCIVYRSVGYQPQRISTHAVEFAISGYSTISDAIGWTYEEEGHTFYVLTFPTGNATWVYDVATQMWHQRAYMNQSTSALSRDLANCHAFFNRSHVVGDYQNGKIYTLSLNTYTDNADYIKRLRAANTGFDNRIYEVSTTEPVKIAFTGANLVVEKATDRMLHHRLQVTMETGVGLVSGQGSNPQITMRYSNDNGHTWSNDFWGSAGLYTGGGGNLGEFKRRVIYRRLGWAYAES